MRLTSDSLSYAARFQKLFSIAVLYFFVDHIA
jgi:hypothetical protein